jgi:hypothetical protein
MSQSLEVNIKTTSDVPQAMDKAKTATVSFGKQVDDIQRKFSTAFKDIFLGFTAPLVIMNSLFRLVSDKIAETRKKQEDANQAAIDGTNALISAEDRYYAIKRNNEKKTKENTEQSQLTREQITKDFLENDPRGKKIVNESETYRKGSGESAAIAYLAQNKEAQDKVQAIIAEDMKKNPLTIENKDADKFKGPEGFGNVIGVGPNPVMEAMARQIEIQEQQLAELKKISGTDNAVPTDFTKTPSK